MSNDTTVLLQLLLMVNLTIYLILSCFIYQNNFQ
jgi:hypothetical protein